MSVEIRRPYSTDSRWNWIHGLRTGNETIAPSTTSTLPPISGTRPSKIEADRMRNTTDRSEARIRAGKRRRHFRIEGRRGQSLTTWNPKRSCRSCSQDGPVRPSGDWRTGACRGRDGASSRAITIAGTFRITPPWLSSAVRSGQRQWFASATCSPRSRPASCRSGSGAGGVCAPSRCGSKCRRNSKCRDGDGIQRRQDRRSRLLSARSDSDDSFRRKTSRCTAS